MQLITLHRDFVAGLSANLLSELDIEVMRWVSIDSRIHLYLVSHCDGVEVVTERFFDFQYAYSTKVEVAREFISLMDGIKEIVRTVLEARREKA